jgi:polyisoprenoid-binding protein YceI
MTTLVLDKVHSSLTFQIKHMMVSKVIGSFENYEVDFNGDLNNLEDASVNVKIDASSIDTNNTDRDGHLKSGDFFNVEEHPNMTFVSKSVKKTSEGEYEITGDFTIRGVTNTETFHAEYNGTSKNPMDGSTVTGFDVEGKINREDYGLSWNAALETGGVLVGKEVKFSCGFEFVVNE